MKPKFSVTIEKFAVIREIAATWATADFRQILELMDYDETENASDGDLKELCLMALQDLKPQDAAKLVLTYRFGGLLNSGQIQNASHEMLDEKLWEEFADMAQHERMFHVGSLLSQVSSADFPQPDAVSVQISVTATNVAAKELLAGTIEESLVVRLIADGMDGSSALHRMFEEQIAGNHFPEADKIIWTIATKNITSEAVQISLISSGLWLDALQDAGQYESTAHPDAP